MNSNAFHVPQTTAVANTVIIVTVYRKNRIARVTHFRYTSAGTQHTVTALAALGSTTLSAAALAAQAAVVLTADPGPAGNGIAANDYVTFRKPNGAHFQSTVNAWDSGTKTLTLNDNVPTGGLDSGASCWFHGVPGDQTTNQLKPTVSTTTTYEGSDAVGVFEGDKDSPLVMHVDNINAAGTILVMAGIFAVR